MRWELVFPTISLAINIGSIIGYALAGNGIKALYWIGAAIINVSRLF
jgi:hypothetical protein